MPTTPPMPARTSASPTNSRRIAAGSRPSACSSPTSCSRCSTPSLKNNPASSSAETTRNVLKYVKYSPKSVAPLDAASPCARTSYTENPIASGSSSPRSAFSYCVARLAERHPWRRNQTQRGQRAVTRAPQLLPALDRNERLRRRAIAVPVLLVDRAHALQIDRKRRIPVGHAIRVGDARILGNQIAIGRRPQRSARSRATRIPPSACAAALRFPTRSSRS